MATLLPAASPRALSFVAALATMVGVAVHAATTSSEQTGVVLPLIAVGPLVGLMLGHRSARWLTASSVCLTALVTSISHDAGPASALPTFALLLSIAAVSEAIARRVELSEASRHETLARAESAQARAESMLDACPTALLVLDSAGRTRRWSPAAAALFGWSEAEVLGADVLGMLLSPADADLHRQQLTSGGQYRNRPLRMRRRDGQRFAAEVSATQGDGDDLCLFFHDVSVHRKEAEEHRQARADNDALSRNKGQFLASVSHELRTPLNGVLGMTELLLDTTLDPQQEEYATAAYRCAGSLFRRITDLMDYEQLESGDFTLRHEMFSAREHVDDLVAQVLDAHPDKRVAMAVVVHPTVPMMLLGDARRIDQVVHQLLDNAFRFTHVGEVLIEVDATEQPDPTRTKLHVRVSDDGPGIPADRQQGIFEPFVATDPHPDRSAHGVGLGLAICRQIVRQMGGEMGVISDGRSGTTVWFTAVLECSRGPMIPSTPLAGVHVLVVEPSSFQARAVSMLLAEAGASTTCTTTPASAALAIAERPPALVIASQEHSADPALRGPSGTLPLLVLTDDDAELPGPTLRRPYRRKALLTAAVSAFRGTQRPNAPVPHPAADAPRSPETTRPPRVLIVEDNIVNQTLAIYMVERLGYDADVAADGESALRALDVEHYDVVLMDCVMPGMDGFQTTTAIRAREDAAASVPIIALTANVLSVDRERCLATGMNDFLPKPMSMDALRSALGRWTRQPVA